MMASWSDIWHLLNKYKELISNGLDLFSFFLVTPELTKVFAPVIAELTSTAFLFILTFLIGFSPLLSKDVDAKLQNLSRSLSMSEVSPGFVYAVLVMFCMILIISVAAKLQSMVSDRFNAWMTRRALILGVLVFLATRIFSFAMALQEAVQKS